MKVDKDTKKGLRVFNELCDLFFYDGGTILFQRITLREGQSCSLKGEAYNLFEACAAGTGGLPSIKKNHTVH